MAAIAFARPAEAISFSDIIRATDGPLALVPCVSKLFYRRCEDCRDEASCAIRHIMANVRDQVCTILDNTTLAGAASLRDELAAQSAGKSVAHLDPVAERRPASQ